MTSEIATSTSTRSRIRPSEHQGGSRNTPLDRDIGGGSVAVGHGCRYQLLERDQDNCSLYVLSEMRTK